MDDIRKSVKDKMVETLEGVVLELELEVRTLRSLATDPDYNSMKDKIDTDIKSSDLALKFAKKKLEIAKYIK